MKLVELFEGDVVDTKFTQKLGQKKGMTYNPDAEPPKSRKTGEMFDRFEVKELPNGKSATIIGVKGDYREDVGTTRKDVAHVLAGAYNAGGWSQHNIQKVGLGEKKKKKKSKGFYSGAWNKAEQHTKYDPPNTKNKGKSARRGFVG